MNVYLFGEIYDQPADFIYTHRLWYSIQAERDLRIRLNNDRIAPKPKAKRHMKPLLAPDNCVVRTTVEARISPTPNMTKTAESIRPLECGPLCSAVYAALRGYSPPTPKPMMNLPVAVKNIIRRKQVRIRVYEMPACDEHVPYAVAS